MNHLPLLNKFLSALVGAHGLSAQTASAYRQKLTPMLKAWDDIPLSEFDYALFEDYVSAQTWAPRTKLKFTCCCKRFVRWCKDRKLPVQDFVGSYKAPKAEPTNPRVATREEVLQLLAATIGHRMHVAIALAALAGLRRAELDGLLFGDVDLENSLLTVRSTKTKKTDVVDISSRLNAILTSWKRSTDKDNDQVIRFPSFGLGTANGNRDLAKLCARLKIPRLSWKALRHFFCSTMLNSGAPVGNVQALMRHGSLAVTSIYAHPNREGTAAAVELVL